MKRSTAFGRGSLLALLLVGLGQTPPPHPTPEIRAIDALGGPDMVAYAMRAPLDGGGGYVGVAVACARRGPPDMQATAFFGAFPGAHHPVQLAVRGPDGREEHFGPVVAADPTSGFHSPQLRAPPDVERFVQAALQPGALVSNGYRSFWNRVTAARNQQVREEFVACVRRPPE